ncbi:hypothetical protein [Paeniglutamicibacter cryotolerans]|uniref:PH domain-containing protein n=1 Tax=Paeniglutamicibacter cryotolerans TaxID=670079 RepID=A0A839QJL1_9MICC|nr:hypothetical protein [Paeniglutamicibacter cryotolerans]MBB2996030.1 hypothetical protein [Paeniglutamicibacter cryotolerans]
MRLRLERTERVIVKTRAHPRALRRPLFAGYLLLAVFPFALAFLSRGNLPDALASMAPALSVGAAVLGALLFIWWCLRPLWKWNRHLTYLTNRRLIAKAGTLTTGETVSLYAVHGINVQARAEGGPGTLRIAAGEKQAVYRNLPGVHKMAHLVQEAIMALPRGLRVDGVNMEVNETTDGTEHG